MRLARPARVPRSSDSRSVPVPRRTGAGLANAAGTHTDRVRRHGEPDEAREAEREHCPADLHQPASDKPANGRKAGERKQVEADDSTTEMIRGTGLDERVRIGRQQREAPTEHEEEDPALPDAVQRRECEHRRAEPDQPCEQPRPARAPECRRAERAGERPRPEGRGENAERPRSGVQGVRGEQREDDVEVEADRAHHRDDGEHETEVTRLADEGKSLADAVEHGCAWAARHRVELVRPHREQAGENREEAERVHEEARSHVDRCDEQDRKSTRLNSSHIQKSRMPSSA